MKNMINVTCESTILKTKYEGQYFAYVCIGELIRNLCVNLRFDPDTVDGITKNVIVMDIDKKEIRYDPESPISSLCGRERDIKLVIEPRYSS